MTIKCTHNGCNGELEPYEHPKRENSILFKCNRCQCIFTLTSVTKAVGCPSLKDEKKKGTKVFINVGEGSQPVIKEAFIETKSLSTSEPIVKRGRGRPRKKVE